MKNVKIISISAIVFLMIFGCTKEKDVELDNEKIRSKFAGLARDYTLGLKSILKKNMKSGGPLKAITVCADTASDLTKMFADAMGLDVRRVSLKNRNPKNIPDEVETKILLNYEKLLSEGKLDEKTETFEEYVINGEKVLRYMKPLIIDAPCLNCHGNENQISQEVANIIKENYPDDKALNFAIGDLRGAVSITKKL